MSLKDTGLGITALTPETDISHYHGSLRRQSLIKGWNNHNFYWGCEAWFWVKWDQSQSPAHNYSVNIYWIKVKKWKLSFLLLWPPNAVGEVSSRQRTPVWTVNLTQESWLRSAWLVQVLIQHSLQTSLPGSHGKHGNEK